MEATILKNTSFIGIGGAGSASIVKLLGDNPNAEAYIADGKMGPDIEKELIKLGISHPSASHYFFECNMEDSDAINEWIEDCIITDNVVLICGLGGKYGSGLVCKFAEQAKKLSKNVTVLCFMPYRFEARSRHSLANGALLDIMASDAVDYLAYISGDELMSYMSRDLSFPEVLKCGHYILMHVFESMVNKKCAAKVKITISDHINGFMTSEQTDCVYDRKNGYFKIETHEII